MLTDSVALLFRAEIAGVEVPIQRWKSLSAYASTNFAKTGLGFADMHAAIAHAKAGNNEAIENIIINARGPVANLTKKISQAYLYMQDKEWSKASNLFLEVIPDHARFGGSNAQRDLIDFSLATCLIHQGRKNEAQTVLSITRPRALKNRIIEGLH